jgi:hypothetical protein
MLNALQAQFHPKVLLNRLSQLVLTRTSELEWKPYFCDQLIILALLVLHIPLVCTQQAPL